MEVITYSEWIEQSERQTAQQIALLTAQAGVDGIVDVANFAAFPTDGIEGYLYLAKDTGKLYSWNATDKEYVRVDSDYTLPVATNEVLGGVKVGTGLTIAEGVLSADEYILPTASDTVLGGVKVGSGLTITGDVLSYTLPTATNGTLGGVKVGTGLSINEDGVLSANGYTLPAATDTVLGGVKVGGNLTIDGDGILASAHPAIAIVAGTTGTLSPAYKETFEVIDSVTRDTEGHVTELNTTTITLPVGPNLTFSETETAPAITDGQSIVWLEAGRSEEAAGTLKITFKVPGFDAMTIDIGTAIQLVPED